MSKDCGRGICWHTVMEVMRSHGNVSAAFPDLKPDQLRLVVISSSGISSGAIIEAAYVLLATRGG